MGVLEFRHLHLYPLRWYPQKPGGPHLQGQVRQSGPVDTGAGPGQRSHYRPKHQHVTHSSQKKTDLVIFQLKNQTVFQ